MGGAEDGEVKPEKEKGGGRGEGWNGGKEKTENKKKH